ncbi:Na/Pi symporter [Sediminitomix flava]|uniref:Sodium-dependent phosphate cotransporter n=1 Tax=Sediminitomix flava TaxID=379075 RepID=A0A315ZBR4_SEDFL|nr:Na/Pi symporter [Sediminitomix flava]PWJ42599.1 sodium-dependent phosphate cotransporter [Sediminitomix flava]
MVNNRAVQFIGRLFKVLVVLFVFLVALELMSKGFKLLGGDTAKDIFSVTDNPFIGLLIGMLSTAIIQSSSTSTSMIVAIVASGSLTLHQAVPMIMGANIGTSVTSTIVALGHMGDKKEFRNAISAATVHDFFNLIVVTILFPLQITTHFLSNLGGSLADFFYDIGLSGSGEVFNILSVTVKPAAGFLGGLIEYNHFLMIGLGVVILFISLRVFTTLLKSFFVGTSQEKMEQIVFGSPIKSLTWGTLITAGVQSSSVTTALAVPLVAAGKVNLKQVFPFLMGANIGTTVTALLAALSQNEAALAIACCHLLFNCLGVGILFPIQFIRNIPIFLAERLGKLSEKYRFIGLVYILVVFFLIPFSLIYATSEEFGTYDVSRNTQEETLAKREQI